MKGSLAFTFLPIVYCGGTGGGNGGGGVGLGISFEFTFSAPPVAGDPEMG